VQDTVVLGEEPRRWLGTPWMGAVTHALERAVRASYKARRPVTSFRQMEANRRNALRSTGPKSHNGKQQSRRNALRHGLTAETVIEGWEDTEDYTAFEAAIISDYDAGTAVERELVLRLASLLWQMRRAISIETDLLTNQTDFCATAGMNWGRGETTFFHGLNVVLMAMKMQMPALIARSMRETCAPCRGR
jgi:hypothetical protein